MRIFHLVPGNNNIPCGGIKVHYRLVELERDLGYESYFVLPNSEGLPWWFKINHDLVMYAKDETELFPTVDDLVIGWEDPNFLRRFKCKRVVYIQGEVLVDRNWKFDSVGVWFSSFWNRQELNYLNGPIVPLYIDPSVYYPLNKVMPSDVTASVRKQGVSRLEEFYSYVGRSIPVLLIPEVSETEWADRLRHSKIFLSLTYPEGFGLQSLEAMASGCIVVGFTGGGGSDYMIDGVNCFTAPDGNYGVLARKLWAALQMTEGSRMKMVEEALKTVSSYSREQTKKHLEFRLQRIERGEMV